MARGDNSRRTAAWPPAPDPGLFRVRRISGEVGLDCECRTTLDDALERIAALEAIRMLLHTLEDVGGIADLEPDGSAFGEFADLFDAAASHAASGVRLMRSLEDR
jgi:hypothetical protein